MKEGKRAKKRKTQQHLKKHQVPAEMAAEPALAKYWAQRYRLFSRFDHGIKLDRGQRLSAVLEPYCVILSDGVLLAGTWTRTLTSVVAVCFRGLVLRDSREDCRAHCSQGGPELRPRSAGRRRLLRRRRERHPVRTDWKKRRAA